MSESAITRGSVIEQLVFLEHRNVELQADIIVLREDIERLWIENNRLRKNAEQDAKYLSAYHRICQKHGIAPSSSDLIAAMEDKE